MRRIVNILAKMVSAIVLALIFLPLLVALLFEIPAAQNFVAREATEIISRKLGTRISIDRVDIGLFYRAIRCSTSGSSTPTSRASASSAGASRSAAGRSPTPSSTCGRCPTGR